MQPAGGMAAPRYPIAVSQPGELTFETLSSDASIALTSSLNVIPVPRPVFSGFMIHRRRSTSPLSRVAACAAASSALSAGNTKEVGSMACA